MPNPRTTPNAKMRTNSVRMVTCGLLTVRPSKVLGYPWTHYPVGCG